MENLSEKISKNRVQEISSLPPKSINPDSHINIIVHTHVCLRYNIRHTVQVV